MTQIDGLNGRHEYSRFDPFNADQSMILLLPELDWRVCRTNALPYNQSSNLVMNLLDVEEPRWDAVDPRLIWGLKAFSVITVNVQTGQTTIVKDFTNDPVIGPIIHNRGAGSLSHHHKSRRRSISGHAVVGVSFTGV